MWSEVIRWMSSFAVSCDLLHILQLRHRPIPDLEPCHLQGCGLEPMVPETIRKFQFLKNFWVKIHHIFNPPIMTTTD